MIYVLVKTEDHFTNTNLGNYEKHLPTVITNNCI